MYFLIAWRELPPRSLRAAIAAMTISEVRGWVGLLLGFFALAAAVFFGLPLVDATGAADSAADAAAADLSAIVDVCYY